MVSMQQIYFSKLFKCIQQSNEMYSYSKIDSKKTANLENADYLRLPLTIEIDQESLIIDLTEDKCVSPVGVDENVQNKVLQKKRNITSKKNEANIQSTNSSTCATESKKQLKQTHLNLFFASAKRLSGIKKTSIFETDLLQKSRKIFDDESRCKSLEKDITKPKKFYSSMKLGVIDECQCLSVQKDEIKNKTLPTDNTEEKQMPVATEIEKGLTTTKNRHMRLNYQKKQQMSFMNQEVIIDLCSDSIVESKSEKLLDLKQPQIDIKRVYKRLETVSKYQIKEEETDLCLTSFENCTKINPKNKDYNKLKTHTIKNIESLDFKNKTKNVIAIQKLKKVILENEPNILSKSFKSKKLDSTKNLSLSEISDLSDDDKNRIKKESILRRKRPGTVESEKNECPPYKVIEGTTFAVDAFNYGRLKNVTAYFLTHFHTDHYVGLTKKFSMPIYASEITLNLIRGFISVEENLLNVLFLNITLQIEDVRVTAIDANHCPGAIMLLFELPCGKRILHTGDFRWSSKMELDQNLQQQNIELVYLDTTHISDKHSISSQEECISKAIQCVSEFKQRNEGKKILFVVCTDVIGKENFWLSIAKAFDLKVWSDGKRNKALSLIGNEDILKILVSNANEADLHVVSHTEAGYKNLDEYFRQFSDSYDMVLSIKPKGSESLNPEFGVQVNSISVRYSEHSPHKDLRRFLRLCLPKRVISTVPLGTNIFRCPKVPVSWHTKELYVPYRKQASLLNYISVKNE